MITLDRCYRLLDTGFSLITASANKKPNMHTWKEYQTTPITKPEMAKAYNGETTSAKTEIIGILTGYNNLEVIDVDLKVFPTLPEQEEFWHELHSYLKDNIDDFHRKFVIYKTKNQGYHILYKCDTIEGNLKIAKLKGHKECIIESRGIGGYVVVYDNQISKLDYLSIQTISERDRRILWSICRTYNYVDPSEQLQPDKKVAKEYDSSNITPWQDYNEKTSIYDIIGEDFKIVRKLAKHDIILRHGAESSQSGYVYKDSGCMFLFSTGTIYPNEKLITPFIAYAYKYHNGNMSVAGKELYSKGFGSRIVKPLPENRIKTSINTDDLKFPIDIFPAPIQNYMIECNNTLDSSIDYMGCSMLWVTSIVVGNSIHIEVKRGWVETANVWIAVVGKAGLGKTPSIKNIIHPLMKINSKEIKSYLKHAEKYAVYSKSSESEKKQVEDVPKPVKTQFIANDITLEALVDLHEQSKNAVGVFKDELNGWFKDMNKYREGSDLEFWLSTWSGSPVSFNRMSRVGSFVERPLIPVLGGIQPSILNTFYTDENKDNGFVDRMLLTFPELEVEHYNDNEMPYDAVEWYTNAIQAFYEHYKRRVVNYNLDMEIDPYIARLSDDARIEWKRIFNEITSVQNSDEENEYMKSMLPKQKSYIPRFALLIHCLDCYMTEKPTEASLLISKESMLKAERLSKYFVAMAKKIKVNTMEVKEMKSIISSNKKVDTRELFKELYLINPELNRSETAELLGISKRQIFNYINELCKTVQK